MEGCEDHSPAAGRPRPLGGAGSGATDTHLGWPVPLGGDLGASRSAAWVLVVLPGLLGYSARSTALCPQLTEGSGERSTHVHGDCPHFSDSPLTLAGWTPRETRPLTNGQSVALVTISGPWVTAAVRVS